MFIHKIHYYVCHVIFFSFNKLCYQITAEQLNILNDVLDRTLSAWDVWVRSELYSKEYAGATDNDWSFTLF